MQQERKKELVEAINQLYISSRKKYISQYKTKEGTTEYWTLPTKKQKEKNDRNHYLIDHRVVDHLDHKMTIGVFPYRYNGLSNSKFICFDVDTKENSEKDTRYLLEVMESLNIRREDIHVSLSGSKGYHVEMFFDKGIPVDTLEIFYKKVLKETGFNMNEVELRPRATAGVKLPLGIHRKTDEMCWYINNETFEPIKDYGYILGIEKLDAEIFKEEYCEDYREEIERDNIISDSQHEEIRKITKSLNMGFMVDGIKSTLRDIVDDELLKEPDTRNDMTLFLSMYFRDMGYEPLDVEMIINRIMFRTLEIRPGYIKSPPRKIERETSKIVKQTFKKGYTLNVGKRYKVRIYKDEVDDILNIEHWHHKKLYLSMLVHSKRVEREGEMFFMSYGMMRDMGNKVRSSKLKGYIDSLVEEDMVEVISRGALAEGVMYGAKYHKYKANEYKIKKISNHDGEYIEIGDDGSTEVVDNLVSVLVNFYDIKELGIKLKRGQLNIVKRMQAS